jgi:hypothetical protein
LTLMKLLTKQHLQRGYFEIIIVLYFYLNFMIG